MNPTSKLTAAAIGGVAMGVASSIPLLGCLCCAWAVGGGLLASYLWMRHQPPSLSPPYGDGALLGLMTAAIGAIAGMFVQLPLNLLMGAGGMSDAMQQALESMPEDVEVPQQLVDMLSSSAGSAGMTVVGVLVGAVFAFIVYAVLATVGALIGTAVFHKKPAAPVV
ncbi:MAG: hypothetical protein DWQ36_07700 [Acidobacteria bacterium]|nr:MAG: hypothetical protein DWQ30_04125 [Acidobacteriota bacterium]REK08852.1 MAG: hypothetical protein DWQ36_07700 [Acidobacteriota bacterium]